MLYEHAMHYSLLRKARWILKQPSKRGVISTGELLAIALVLNKPKWIADAGYTLSDALERLGSRDVSLALFAARDLHNSSIP